MLVLCTISPFSFSLRWKESQRQRIMDCAAAAGRRRQAAAALFWRTGGNQQSGSTHPSEYKQRRLCSGEQSACNLKITLAG